MIGLVFPFASAAQNQPDDAQSAEPASPTVSTEDSNPASGTTDVVLWLFHGDGGSAERTDRFRKALREALSGADRRHVLSRSDFQEYLADRAASVPACLKGVEPCISPQTVVIDQLDLNAVVRVRLRAVDDQLQLEYRLLDRRGSTAKRAKLEGDEIDSLAFSLVRDLFDATGTVSIRSTPGGSALRVDGKEIGTTPIETRLPVGEHSFRLRHAKRRPVEGTFDLGSGEHVEIDRELPRMPGKLVVESAPKEAVVYVDGQKKGTTGTAIELDPGSYELKVEAEGYQPHEGTVRIEPGESVRRNVPMEPDTSLLKDIDTGKIALNRYVARVTFDQSVHHTSFRDARGSSGDRFYELEEFTSRGQPVSPGTAVQSTFDPRGIRADFSYTRRHFGVVALSLSYAGTSADRRATFSTARDDDRELLGTVTQIRRLQLRPLQVTYRRFFKNFVPSVELGTGITFQWFNVEGIRTEDGPPVTFRQTEAFWTLGVTGQYFFNTNWFGVVRYSFQDYFNTGRGVEHVVSLGVGAAYPDVFGFAPEPPEEL